MKMEQKQPTKVQTAFSKFNINLHEISVGLSKEEVIILLKKINDHVNNNIILYSNL